MWLPENTIDTTSNKPMSKKDIDQYSESTMIAVFELKVFEHTVIIAWDKSIIHIVSIVQKHVFPFGLPILVIIDLCIIRNYIIIIFLETLGIPYYIVPPDSHNSILCQILDRFFNKIQCFHATDFPTYKQWILGIIFILYACKGQRKIGRAVILL